MDKDIATRIDKLAEKAGYSRSKAAKNLLSIGLDLIEDYERFKLVSLTLFIRDRLPKFKEGFKKLVAQIESEEHQKL